ncbi:GDP-mannose transporter into the lumen of the Golgi [Vermiconidia calcicola]|uniref:GDP-mannose transporter into the lumen of the Golgi n=1 Tax=Vermiconidia calcicola TaxID=1690605 RepID=A0ACC3NE50_9PEZI|nr:GDP-mannose transporter into the lumen of the Golgi [Vermiconidia calcicola]
MADEKKRDDVEPGEKQPNGHFDAASRPPPSTMQGPPIPIPSVANNPLVSILTYCGSSILMTVANKYVVSGRNFNLNFFLLFVQALVCLIAITSAKAFGIVNFREFNSGEAKKWFPISLLLIGMIYTSTKALQFISVPVYTIFKNLTIILIAYGEVLWFGGSVTPTALLSFALMVGSSIIAAWADIQHVLQSYGGDALTGEAAEQISTLNAGYMWMLMNCFCTASFTLGMRKRLKLMNFKDLDTMFYNNLLSLPVLLVASLFLENWSSANLALNFPEGARTYMISAMIFTGLSSILISYASANCMRVTSSTTYSMVGALNKLPIAISGLVFFHAPVTLASVSAIIVGFVSGIVYTVAKIWQKEADRGAAQKGILPTTSASSQSMRDSLKS